MNQFNIQPLAQFAGSSAAIRRPKEIACFSYDDSHDFHLDERSLRYYYTPRIGADLSKGFDTFQQIDDTADDHLDSLLKTIIDLEKRTGTRCEADIVTWRGMMTKIMATPFDNMAGFEMNATRFQDTIFIEENHAHKLASRQSQQHRQPSGPGGASQDLMSYWGYKFETLSVLPQPWDRTSRDFIEGREDMIARNYAQYCSVVKTGIGRAKLVIGGEVDAVWDRKPASMMMKRAEERYDDDEEEHPHPHPHPQQLQQQPINYVELKTTAQIASDRDLLKYERKLLKFWIQSFLLGVPKIVVGFRSPGGILQRVEELETQDLPGMVKKSSNVRNRRPGPGPPGPRGTTSSWDGNVCINFTAGFLDWLKRTVVGGGVWRIRRREGSVAIEVFKVEETGTADVLVGEFVEWRVQQLLRQQEQQGQGQERGQA